MLKIKCDKCKKELDKPGALLFSPPDLMGFSAKRHICFDCFVDLMINWFLVEK